MADMPEMQEQFPAGAWMADMPEMQEQFPAGAWMAPHAETKGYAENAGAFFGGGLEILPTEKRRSIFRLALMVAMPKMQEQFLTAMDGGHAENAGAIFDRHGWRACRKCRSNFRPVPGCRGMPKRRITLTGRRVSNMHGWPPSGNAGSNFRPAACNSQISANPRQF